MNWFGTLQIDMFKVKSDFDMILKLVSQHQTNNGLVNFVLADALDQKFYLQYNDNSHFKVGDILKIRSIAKM